MTEQQGKAVVLWLKIIAALLAAILIASIYTTVAVIQSLDDISVMMVKNPDWLAKWGLK